MQSKKNLFTILIFIILGTGFYFLYSSQGSDELNEQTQVKSLDEKETFEEKEEKVELLKEETAEVKEDKPLTKKLETLIVDINKDVSECQKKIESLFPEKYIEDDKIPYKTVKDIKKAVTSFYKVLNHKNSKTHQIITFFENNESQNLDPKATFEKISSIPDCGDFEEEVIMDALVSYISEHQFSTTEKKEISRHLLKEFSEQLDGKAALHHLISKIDSVESMVDENILPASIEKEIESLNQMLEDSEEDFRDLLPTDFAKKRYLSPKQIVLIKKREEEIIERMKVPVKQMLSEGLKALQ